MSKKLRKSNFKVCVTKRRNETLALMIAYFFETVWAIGASVVAAIGISTLTRKLSMFDRRH
jgi:hypothetical protein